MALKLSLPIFSATLFISAFLLFSVQPFFAKMVLPKLGGSPAVWSVAMVFFQSVLLAGYAYAHLITTKLSTRNGVIVHFIVIAAAFYFLPMAVAENWGTAPQTGQTLWLLGLFTVSIGVPFFAVSANGPLLQAWFARTGHAHSADPYFLYGASNIGSFASLFLYIILIEPLNALGEQANLWMFGFILLALSIGACALVVMGREKQMTPVNLSGETPSASQPISAKTKLLWVLYAAIPSGLMVAVTVLISTDIAAVPFLWVAPLALFLLTFVFAFAKKPWFSTAQLSRYLPLFAAAAILATGFSVGMPIYVQLIIHLGFFFVAALFAHSLLVAIRPEASQLTAFYFWMSFGGVLGGIFASLLSPLLFNWVAEYIILIVAVLLIRPEIWATERKQIINPIMIFGAIALILNLPFVSEYIANLFNTTALLFLFLALGAVVAIGHFRSEALHVMAIILVCGISFLQNSNSNGMFTERSFFGVIKAEVSDDGRYNSMLHGTTLHGAMARDSEGKPEPLTYYYRDGGIAQSLFAAQAKPREGALNVGIVGLGVGSMLCHRQPNEVWTLFEIDPIVIDLANRSDIFRYMSDCGEPNDETIIGDARLSIVDQTDEKFDYLLIDAFSSDSIPVHLLTTQAMELFRSKLKQNGILTFHISNRHMELESVLAANANTIGMQARIDRFKPSEEQQDNMITPSIVVSLAADDDGLGTLLTDDAWIPLNAKQTRPWTDDYSNVLAAILRHSKK